MKGVGFLFRPSVKFLIQVLQYKAAGGGDLSAATEVPGDLSEFDLYGQDKEPWNVFRGDHEIWELHDSNKKKLKEKYVVTQLSKIGAKKVSRVAGAGSWDDQSKVKPVQYDGHVVGHVRTLTYEYCGDDVAAASKCYYYMHEYHLSKHSLEEAGVSSTDYVICRILKNETKGCRIKHNSKKCVRKESILASLDHDHHDLSHVKEENHGGKDIKIGSVVKPMSQLDDSEYNSGVTGDGYYFPNQVLVQETTNPNVCRFKHIAEQHVATSLDDDQDRLVKKQKQLDEDEDDNNEYQRYQENTRTQLDDNNEYQEYNQSYYFPDPVYDPNFCGYGQDAGNEEQHHSNFSTMNYGDLGNCNIDSSSYLEFLHQINFDEVNFDECMVSQQGEN